MRAILETEAVRHRSEYWQSGQLRNGWVLGVPCRATANRSSPCRRQRRPEPPKPAGDLCRLSLTEQACRLDGPLAQSTSRAWRRTEGRKLGTDASSRTGAALTVRNPVETRTQGKDPARRRDRQRPQRVVVVSRHRRRSRRCRGRRTREPARDTNSPCSQFRAVRRPPCSSAGWSARTT